jgi:hypothetical protein
MHNSLRKAVFGLCLAALILCAAGEAPATSVDDFFYAGRCGHRPFMGILCRLAALRWRFTGPADVRNIHVQYMHHPPLALQ